MSFYMQLKKLSQIEIFTQVRYFSGPNFWNFHIWPEIFWKLADYMVIHYIFQYEQFLWPPLSKCSEFAWFLQTVSIKVFCNIFQRNLFTFGYSVTLVKQAMLLMANTGLQIMYSLNFWLHIQSGWNSNITLFYLFRF